MSSIIKVACTLSDGMFSNEYAVEISTKGGKVASFFLDKEFVLINGSKNTGHIRANLIKDEGSDCTVLLPKEAIEEGTRWVQVPRHQITFARVP
jgi:hypothetical protein